MALGEGGVLDTATLLTQLTISDVDGRVPGPRGFLCGRGGTVEIRHLIDGAGIIEHLSNNPVVVARLTVGA